MRALIQIIAAIALVGGLFLFAQAFTTPGGYPLAGASAAQITQVYAEATYRALLAIAAFTFSGLLMLAVIANREP